jgi:hypothetical protein
MRMARPSKSGSYLKEHMTAVDTGLAGIKRNWSYGRDKKLRTLIAATESAFADVTRHVASCQEDDAEDKAGT